MGLVRRGHSYSGRERNCVFLNIRQPRFANISAVSGFDFEDDARGLGLTDWDFDGDLDLWVVNRSGPQVRYLRNDVPPENHFLKLRLRGQTCNRDAIGARVEVHLADGAPPLLKTLRAGDGFLSQSSKWLVFGLGKATQIAKVVVRWPGGAAEEFSGPRPDNHYLLVQGAGKAEAYVPPGRPQLHAPQSIAPQYSGPIDQIVIGERVPFPAATYKSFDGDVLPLARHRGRPLLVTFWATWCRPCVVELRALNEQAAALQAAGVDVLALSVDGLADDRSSHRDAWTMIATIAPNLQAAMATTELVDLYYLVLNRLIGRDLAPAIPASFLLDSNSELAVAYPASLQVPQVLAHVRDIVPLSGPALMDAATPFPGQWLHRIGRDLTTGVAQELLDNGFEELALAYTQAHRERIGHDPDFLDYMLHLVNYLMRRGRFYEAIPWCQEAVASSPKLVTARHLLGLCQYRSGQFAEAVASFREVVATDRQHAPALQSLAWILATCPDSNVRNGKEAVEWAERAFRVVGRPDSHTYDILACAYAADGQFEKAVAVATQARDLAQEMQLESTLSTFQGRIEDFRRRKPFVESPPTVPLGPAAAPNDTPPTGP
jgi:tetratricopeptide (TPR) repeat protein